MVMSNPRAQQPEDAKFVYPSEGHEHGYYGTSPGIDEDATVAGVTGGTANVSDSPSKEAAAKTRANTAALKKQEADK
jgi:hypothetical protein